MHTSLIYLQTLVLHFFLLSTPKHTRAGMKEAMEILTKLTESNNLLVNYYQNALTLAE
jgi:hypothetical protein